MIMYRNIYGDILTEEDMMEEICMEVNESFYEWINDNYNAYAIYMMSENEKLDIYDDYIIEMRESYYEEIEEEEEQ